MFWCVSVLDIAAGCECQNFYEMPWVVQSRHSEPFLQVAGHSSVACCCHYSVTHFLLLSGCCCPKSTEFSWKDVWSVGCFHYGLHLYSNHCESPAHDGLLIFDQLARYQCWWQCWSVVCVCVYLLWNSSDIHPGIMTFYLVGQISSSHFWFSTMMQAFWFWTELLYKWLPNSSCVELQENIYWVMFTLMSTWYFWLSLLLVPLVALLVDLFVLL